MTLLWHRKKGRVFHYYQAVKSSLPMWSSLTLVVVVVVVLGQEGGELWQE